MSKLVNRRIELPVGWVDFSRLTGCLKSAGELESAGIRRVHFYMPHGCNIMVDAGAQLLSLFNQLARAGKDVVIEFADGNEGVMGYLDRLGFFDWLDESIQVVPDKPVVSRARLFAGNNKSVVEYIPISPDSRDREIPGRLADHLERACSAREDHVRLGRAAFTLFAELIDNIYEHSETKIDGYAALQTYRKAGTVLVTVSDSGHGIIDTIRGALKGTPLETAPDPRVIVHLFNHGLSRFGQERGCGLRQCADHALRYGAEVFIRLPRSSLHLVPGVRGYRQRNVAYGMTDLPLLQGTHIAFNFQLDKQSDFLL